MNNTALATTHTENLMFMPVMDMEVAVMRRNNVVEFVKRIMVDGVDYGKIPGAGDKPTLLKPGAEKLSTFFGLTPMFIPISVTEDWTGDEHKGEAFFYYRYRCELHRNGNLVASSEGSCNTWESKYRYRKGERVCPSCGQPAIKKSKYPPKGRPSDLPGWYCFSKAQGCGAEFDANDKRIVDQEVGRVLNPDVADQVNTVQKMAQKRALIAATLLAVNASEFFTQDIEDMVIDGEWTPVVETESKLAKQAQRKAESAPSLRPTITDLDTDDSGMNEAASPTEAAIISQWDGPKDAQNWAIKVGACDNTSHASESWMKSVRACKGYNDKNKQEVFLHFLNHQYEKLGTDTAVAQPVVEPA